jgi:TfdA family taurine catabolism dioxygenase TauD
VEQLGLAPEGRAVIDELIAHATQRQFMYTHRWRIHDLVIWDDRCTMHRGTEFDDLRWKRDMQRATVSDVANSCEQEGIAVAAARHQSNEETPMAQEARELICMITSGTDHELSSIGFTIANGGITAGLKVFIFLSSSGVDLCGSTRRIPHKSIRSNLSLNSSTILWREGEQSGPALPALRAVATVRATS